MKPPIALLQGQDNQSFAHQLRRPRSLSQNWLKLRDPPLVLSLQYKSVIQLYYAPQFQLTRYLLIQLHRSTSH